MDRQPALAARPDAVHCEQIDQAIFTSIRSCMARGYRIVAASAGLPEDEKREIVQRAPSHGNLSDASEHARARAGFVLRSGRYCLLLARHAGPEPSGRGGYRVHTHALALAPALYRRFCCDPVAVERFARPLLESAAQKVPSPALPAIPVPGDLDGTAARSDGAAPTGDDVPSILQIVAAVLAARPTVVVGAPGPRAVLPAVIAATPIGVRQGLSFAHGMKLSTQRDFRLLFHDAGARQLGPIVRDQSYALLRWGVPTAPPATPFEPWLAFVRGNWERGCGRTVRALTDELEHECTPEALTRVAALATDAAAAEIADADAASILRDKWRNMEPTGPVQRRLLERLERLTAERIAAQACVDDRQPGNPPAPPAERRGDEPQRVPPGV